MIARQRTGSGQAGAVQFGSFTASFFFEEEEGDLEVLAETDSDGVVPLIEIGRAGAGKVTAIPRATQSTSPGSKLVFLTRKWSGCCSTMTQWSKVSEIRTLGGEA